MDKVNHPAHYNAGKYEVIDVIEDWKLGFCLGNVVKYVARAGHKDNAIEDLEKAAWYLQREIERMKKEASKENTPRVVVMGMNGYDVLDNQCAACGYDGCSRSIRAVARKNRFCAKFRPKEEGKP